MEQPSLISLLYEGSSNTIPIIVCSAEDTSAVTEQITKLADSLVIQYKLYPLQPIPSGQEIDLAQEVQKDISNGLWIIVPNAQSVSSEILRQLGLGVINTQVSSMSPSFRFWMTVVGDIDPNDASHYPSSLLVPALIGLSNSQIITKATHFQNQVKESVRVILSSDVLKVEEALYANDRNLTTLKVYPTQMPYLTEILEGLKYNRTVLKADFSNLDIGIPEMNLIADMLEYNTMVKELCFIRCTITDHCVEVLCRGLRGNATVKKIDLAWNPSVTDAGLRMLAMLLASSQLKPCLKSFLFYSNNAIRHHHQTQGIHFSSFRVLADVLKTNTRLTELNLSNTILTPRDTLALAKTVAVNASLKILDLSANRFGDEAGVAIAKLLSRNSMLESLNISSTRISCVTVIALGQALRKNTTLRSLTLNGNRVIQLPEPQILSNSVYDEVDDYMGDPAPEYDSDEEKPKEGGPDLDDPDAQWAHNTEDIHMEVPPITLMSTKYAAQKVHSNALPPAVMKQMLQVVASRYQRLEGITSLAEAMETSSLTYLSLSECGLDDESLKVLSDHISLRQTVLASLNLNGNGDNGDMASMAVKNMITANAIGVIDLGSTTGYIAERAILALEMCTTLHDLDISNCDLKDGVADELYRVLLINKLCPLQTVSYARNPLTKYSLQIFGNILRENLGEFLTHMDLSYSADLSTWKAQGVEDMERFGNALQRNHRLRHLKFLGNGLTTIATERLLKGVQVNYSLNYLDLSENYIDMSLFQKFYRQDLEIIAENQKRLQAITE